MELLPDPKFVIDFLDGIAYVGVLVFDIKRPLDDKTFLNLKLNKTPSPRCSYNLHH